MSELHTPRGRHTMGRRRVGHIVTGSSFVAAAVLAAALVIPGASGNGASAPATGDSGAVSTSVGTQLVAYTGKQPAGFTLDQAPTGWEVQGVDKYVLTLAPKNAKDQDFHSFIGKIAISLEQAVPAVPKKNVKVGDKPAVLATMLGAKDGRTLFVKQPSGTFLSIQLWDGLGWGEKEIVQFATGVHVNKDAGISVG